MSCGEGKTPSTCNDVDKEMEWRLQVATFTCSMKPRDTLTFFLDHREKWDIYFLKGFSEEVPETPENFSETLEKFMNSTNLFLIFLHFQGQLLNRKASLCKSQTMLKDWKIQYCENVSPSQESPETGSHCHLTLKKKNNNVGGGES